MVEKGKWRLKQGRKMYASLTAHKMQQLILEGKVTADDLAWREGFRVAKRISEVEEFKPFMNANKRKASVKR